MAGLSALGEIVGVAGDLQKMFGGKTAKSASSSNNKSFSTGTMPLGVTTQKLDISQEGIDKIVADVLGGAGGLKDIFSGEQASGLYGSSVANQAAGDLTSKLVGEIAKLTGTTTTEGKANKDVDIAAGRDSATSAADKKKKKDDKNKKIGQALGASVGTLIPIPGVGSLLGGAVGGGPIGKVLGKLF